MPVAFDIGPSNALIDAAVRQLTDGARAYDARRPAGRSRDGWTRPRSPNCCAEPYYALPVPKSTGKELFHDEYLARVPADAAGADGADLVATLTALTARTVADAARRPGVDTLVVLRRRLRQPDPHGDAAPDAARIRVRLHQRRFGAPTDTKEAILFALIGWHTAHGLPAPCPSAPARASARVLGAITPGAGPAAAARATGHRAHRAAPEGAAA